MTITPSEDVILTLQSMLVEQLQHDANKSRKSYVREAEVVYEGWYISLKLDLFVMHLKLWHLNSLSETVLHRDDTIAQVFVNRSSMNMYGKTINAEILKPIVHTLHILLKMGQLTLLNR